MVNGSFTYKIWLKKTYKNGKLDKTIINTYNEKGYIISNETVDDKLITYKYR
jgi:hypothetical protein